MTKVFIGGSRRVGRLNADVRRRIDRIIEQRFPVLVGDANGADQVVQLYLKNRNYDLVEVFCSGGECRNNLGGWPLRVIRTNGQKKDLEFYAAKDREMANEASIGLMIWDGKSTGTLLNILRLIRQDKKVVVYISPAKEFIELKNEIDLKKFTLRCPAEIIKKAVEKSAYEETTPTFPGQGNLF